MDARHAAVLDAAMLAFGGSVVRTAASVIGRREGQELIVATTRFGYSVSALVSVRIAFVVRPRGLLRKTLAVDGSPRPLVDEILDGDAMARLAALAPLHVELGPNRLVFELRYGVLADVVMTVDLVTALAKRARLVDSRAHLVVASDSQTTV